MQPTAFDEENCVLDKPKELSSDECAALSVWRGISTKGIPVVISCWKMTKEELEEISKTGRVWLMVCGPTMPPCAVEGLKPFVQG